MFRFVVRPGRVVPFALVAAFAVAACSPADQAPSSSADSAAAGLSAVPDTAPVPGTMMMTGEVFYLQRIALPEGAEVSVILQDVSVADAPAVEIASTTFKTEGRQVPLPFVLSYEPAKLDASRSYSLAARISNAGELLWISDTHTPVLTRGGPSDSVRVRLSQVPKG